MSAKKTYTTKESKKTAFHLVFDKTNYIWMGIGLLVLSLGYLLLIGGGSKDPNVFSDELFNTRRMVVSPLLMVIGIGIEIYAIMKKPKQQLADEEQA